MTIAYRLCRSLYRPDDGSGAAVYGGRWNAKGVPVVYVAANASLAALEVLVHYSELPDKYSLTKISIPSDVAIEYAAIQHIRQRGRAHPIGETRNYGTLWAKSLRTAVLAVPSAVMPVELNFVLNPAHRDFERILFETPKPFCFDPRLKQTTRSRR